MGITDPLEKDALISNYMKYADKAMTMTLSSLGQMRDALVIAAGQANESNKAELNKAISTTDELKKYLFAINNDWLESKINPKESGGTEDTKFWAAIDKGKNELEQGETWGNVWNRIKMQFPSTPDSKIDEALGKSWREGGAYQAFKSQNPSNQNTITKTVTLPDGTTTTYSF